MKELIAMVARRSMAFATQLAEGVSEGSMNSTVKISRPGIANFDEVSRTYTPPADALVYTGIAGITPAQGPITMALGDEVQYYSSLNCRIPQATNIEPRVDDVIEILTSPDLDVVGRLFRVTDVVVGGRLLSSSSMTAVGIAPSRQWGAD